MKPCCLPNWAGTGSSHVLTKRGIICLSIPSLTVFFSIVAAYSGVAGLPAHPASTRAAAGRARSIVLLSMAFLLLSRACGRPLRHAAPHEEPHAFILPRLDAPRPAKPHGETFAMPQASWFEYGIGANFNLSESTYLWADVERTSGGIIDQEWRATVGVRYGF